ncbi:beta-1,3-galactosyltransferase 2-like [Tachyglossus aculeatus]|uniref:beta-1,3-galactosyltransferase 2-like n=1 Tax=Tachyglossus aculeatus TaxID=9261 RepID=UPI0018F5946B|nr:beta-1,3-galactosyltransferase 2-like [Tachyglossus aculeatus]
MTQEKKCINCSWRFINVCLLTGTIFFGMSYFFFIELPDYVNIVAHVKISKNSVLSLKSMFSFKETFVNIQSKDASPGLLGQTALGSNGLGQERQSMREKPTYHRPYKFLINEEDKCKDKSPFLVLLICTKASEKEHRDSIRKTWGNESLVAGFPVVRLFMLGNHDPVYTPGVQNESKQYHDIIQQNFLDTYTNLTLKVIMGMEWVTTYCPHAKFVMKTDTDMFVNTEYLIQKLLVTIPPTQLFFTGRIMRNHKPIRNKDSKWYMPVDIYPEERYPDFCSGTGYVFSASIAEKVLNASLSIKYLHLEDVYVGLCLHRNKIPVASPPGSSLFNTYQVSFTPCRYNNLITSHQISPRLLITFWEQLQKDKKMC